MSKPDSGVSYNREPRWPLLASAFDDNYVWPWIVQFYSGCTSGGNFVGVVGDVPGALSAESRKAIDSVSEWLGNPVKWVRIELPRNLPVTSYLTSLAYARLALADVLESRFIWLDADTLLLSGWQRIGELPPLPAGIVARACPELPEFLQAPTRNEARIRAGTNYFNSGVMEFDPELWRELGLHQEWPLLIQQYNTHHFEYHDQDILNFLLVGKTVVLPDQFNFQQPFRTRPSVEPKILHYCGELKPWKTRGLQRTRAFCAVSSTPFHWYKKVLDVRKTTAKRGAALFCRSLFGVRDNSQKSATK